MGLGGRSEVGIDSQMDAHVLSFEPAPTTASQHRGLLLARQAEDTLIKANRVRLSLATSGHGQLDVIETENLHRSSLSGLVPSEPWHTEPVTCGTRRRTTLIRAFFGSLAFIGAFVGVMAAPAEATWSIVGVDAETGEVGAAIASCVPVEILGDSEEPLVPLVIVPGVAVGVTQAQLNLDAPPRMRELVAAGASPAEIIDDLSGSEFDEVASLRQHAIIRLPDDGTAVGEADGDAIEVAAITGADNSPEALDRAGEGVSVQGNLLVSSAVVDDALASYQDAIDGDADLASALAEGLLAGSSAGGDRRCGEQTALFAQLVVARPTDDPTAPSILLTVSVDEGDGQNPVVLLAEAHRSGQMGVVDAGAGSSGSGGLVRISALALAGVMVVVSLVALKRGMGSIRARR